MGMVAIEAQASGLPVLASDKVPAEVQVLPGMVKFLGLERSFREWADSLMEMMQLRRSGDTVGEPQWAMSPFNLEVCSKRLKEIYLGHQ
jgi:glycosyltransferase involved in cell wall biosynthesis